MLLLRGPLGAFDVGEANMFTFVLMFGNIGVLPSGYFVGLNDCLSFIIFKLVSNNQIIIFFVFVIDRCYWMWIGLKVIYV